METVKLCFRCFLLRSFLEYIEPYLLKVNFGTIRRAKFLFSASALIISSFARSCFVLLWKSSSVKRTNTDYCFVSKRASYAYTSLGQSWSILWNHTNHHFVWVNMPYSFSTASFPKQWVECAMYPHVLLFAECSDSIPYMCTQSLSNEMNVSLRSTSIDNPLNPKSLRGSVFRLCTLCFWLFWDLYIHHVSKSWG